MRIFRLGLSTRIALTMLLALLLMAGLNAATFFLLPRPDATVYSAHWLISHVNEAAKAIFGAGVAQRQIIAERLTNESKLDINWQPSAPPRPRDENLTIYMTRLQSSLREALSGTAKSISIEMRGRPHGGPGDEPREFVPEGFDRELPTGPLTSVEPDIPIFDGFSIAVEGQDGSWIRVEPHRPEFLTPFLRPPVITAVGAIILISALSIWTAKRSLRPIDQLVVAAQRIGIERQASPIDTRGLGDFVVIGDAINEMQNRIKGFIDERTQMLAAISHDLRTSLTRLRLTSEELPESEAKDSLIKNMEEMEQMVSATLTFAGDDLKRERSERVDIAALLITICDSFSDTGARTEYAGPDHLFAVCQPIAIKRAFVNLVDNAIKYGGSAHIELQTVQDAIRVVIKDEGPGIPTELVERAFRPFSRLEQSRSRETGGVGLGLAIARDIVSAHGGTINLGMRPEGGLEAQLRLPIVQTSVRA
ncbi:ATP-binding protein [Hyphomicrobium sp.]|uniref:ATP-binding protein n=1 Tax=Hyphomicrobium sp. TaxID=82 RepID=UPI003564233D